MFMQIAPKKVLQEAANKPARAVVKSYSIEPGVFEAYQQSLAWLNGHPELWFDGDLKEFRPLTQSSAIVSFVNQVIELTNNLKTNKKKK